MNIDDFKPIFTIIFGIVFIPIIIVIILQIIGLWKVLKKGGKPGWASLIPFYGQYELCEMVGVSPWWIVIVIICPMVPLIGTQLASISAIYFNLLLSFSLAKSFDKDDGFAIGLMLLGPIFYLILGFGKDNYIGPNPMKDVILDDVLKKNSEEKTSETNNESADEKKSYNYKYCPNCGNKLTKKVNFCGKCGRKLS